jgi:hypothetical protein
LKKIIKIFFVIISLVLVGGYLYWQQHKKSIIKNSIQNAVSSGTDSLYFIHYDSSAIDEENGNATFYNVALQSDSLQKQLLEFDTASSVTVYNVHIDEVKVMGADIPALLNNTAVDAKSIHLIHPVVYIINSGKKEKRILEGSDSMAIYKKLLGKYKSISTGEIIIENGYLNFADKTGDPHIALKNISIQLHNFSIDNSKDYKNILSYFIKDVVVKVKEIFIKGDKNQATFSNVEYNAPGKFVRLKKFQQKNEQQKIVFDVNNTSINNIATDSFILKQQLKADELTSDGGLLTFYIKQHKKATKDTSGDEIEIDNNYFNEAILNKVNISNTKILIYNKNKPGLAPLTITNVKFTADDIQKLYSGTTIKNIISRSKWILSADGFSFISASNRYKMTIGAFVINSALSTMQLSSFTVTPQITEQAFSKSSRYQQDLYNLNFKHIELSGINAKLLITDTRLEAETATFEPEIKIFNDRLVTPNPASKIGMYPHQLLQKIKFPVNIKKMIIKKGYVAYKERGAISKETGTVFFKNVNATINNITTAKDVISKNNMLELSATALFMGVSNIQTTWKLPLNTSNGSFAVSGVAGGFNATALNTITEPLGMVSIRQGQFNKITFDLTGNDVMAKGTSLFLYENLKIDILKKDSADTRKKGVQSFVANMLVKNSNPQNGEIRKNDVYLQRDTTKSFFFLLWKSIFAAAKKTVAGKTMDQ